jgi:hypothetical protein
MPFSSFIVLHFMQTIESKIAFPNARLGVSDACGCEGVLFVLECACVGRQ